MVLVQGLCYLVPGKGSCQLPGTTGPRPHPPLNQGFTASQRKTQREYDDSRSNVVGQLVPFVEGILRVERLHSS